MTTVSDYDARRVTDAEAADKSTLRGLGPVPKLTTAVVDDDPTTRSSSSCRVRTCPARNSRWR